MIRISLPAETVRRECLTTYIKDAHLLSLERIEEGAFKLCGFKTVVLPKQTVIEEGAFMELIGKITEYSDSKKISEKTFSNVTDSTGKFSIDYIPSKLENSAYNPNNYTTSGRVFLL